MSVHVHFTHDDKVKLWEVRVTGVETEREARHALNAVLLTCRDENVRVCMAHKAVKQPDGSFDMSIAQWGVGDV